MRDVTAEAFAAVLFDNDGTLVDSTAAVDRTWNAWADEHGVPHQHLGGFHGVPSRTIIAQLVPAEQVEAAVADIDRRELEDTDGIVALPGAAAALSAVRVQAALVTSASLALASLRLEAAGLTPPETVVTADDITHGKPDPEPYLKAAERLGVDPARCLVIEDAPAGLRAGSSAGAATLSVLTTSDRAEVEPLADLVVPDLSAVRLHLAEDGVRVSLR